MRNNWSKEELASLLELVEAGQSSTQIARHLTYRHGSCFTRNAVIGKIHRINQKLPQDERVILKQRGGSQRGIKKAKRMNEPKPRPPKKTVQEALRGFMGGSEPEYVGHIDFYGVALPPDAGQCHYIDGDPKLHTHRYCRRPALKLGADTFNAYCPYHAARCHRDVKSYRDLSELYGLE